MINFLLLDVAYFVVYGSTYKNVYCFMCNEFTSNERPRCENIEQFPVEHSLTFVNFLRWSKGDSGGNSECSTDEILDTAFVSLFNISKLQIKIFRVYDSQI